MTDYKKLVEALRCKGLSNECDSCGYGYRFCPDSERNDACHVERIINDAAAAIEALQARLPKRGEIVRCRECRWGHLCVMGQHLGLDGFCSKGEREVQE